MKIVYCFSIDQFRVEDNNSFLDELMAQGLEFKRNLILRNDILGFTQSLLNGTIEFEDVSFNLSTQETESINIQLVRPLTQTLDLELYLKILRSTFGFY